MTNESQTAFESRRELPDDSLHQRSKRLVGFTARFDRLSGQMRLLTDPDGVRKWAKQHYTSDENLSAVLSDRYPLIIFHGDVGTGKTVTAEVAADALARELESEGFLLKLSTRVRGIGHVGEMSSLIGDAFDEALALAGRSRFVTLIIDEGDALAFHRGAERAHHEDKVGVNTLIQKIDDARDLNGRLLIIICTNRFGALDPAILRRAALIDSFSRPDADERRELLQSTLRGTSLGAELIDRLVDATGPSESKPGFSFSDIQTRLIPAAVSRAYPHRSLNADDLLAAASEIGPSPVMDEGAT
jgi:AAA+ superfamily predicted ATPase